MVLDLNYGNGVAGAQRFSRPALEARLMRTLTQSAGIKMFGLRRIGKTTLRLYATEQVRHMGRPCICIDGQGMHSLGDLLGSLHAAMPGERNFMNRALTLVSSAPARTALEAVFSGMGQEETALSAYWQMVSSAIRAALRGDGPKPVLMIDEFTYLISNMIARFGPNGRDDADRLLASLREWRGDGMTMLLTGSIGLTGLARTHRLTLEHMNDLQPFTVPELSLEEARRFLREATEATPPGSWTEDHSDEFLRQVGIFYPAFLVRGLLEIGIDDPPDPAGFAAIFSERVRPDLHADFLNQFDRRFSAYAGLPNDERVKLILPALKAAMATDGGCDHDSIPCDAPFTRIDLSVALAMLAEDGFVGFTEDADGIRRWKPASGLARLWWRRARLA